MSTNIPAHLLPGVTALKAGNKIEARRLLGEAMINHPNDGDGWLLLYFSTDDPKYKLACLNHAARINPNNSKIKAELKQMLKTGQPSEDDRDITDSVISRFGVKHKTWDTATDTVQADNAMTKALEAAASKLRQHTLQLQEDRYWEGMVQASRQGFAQQRKFGLWVGSLLVLLVVGGLMAFVVIWALGLVV